MPRRSAKDRVTRWAPPGSGGFAQCRCQGSAGACPSRPREGVLRALWFSVVAVASDDADAEIECRYSVRIESNARDDDKIVARNNAESLRTAAFRRAPGDDLAIR